MTPRFFTALIVIAALTLNLIVPPACQAAPAPPLTQLQAEFASPGYAGGQYWDVVPVGGISTPQDHSGSYLQIGVLETGYVSWRQAAFNGQPLSVVGYQPQVNPVTHAIWGYIYYFKYTGQFTSGTFTYSAQSQMVPIRTLSLRIYVR